MNKKKCPICGKPYNDYIKHVWTHKAKTVKYLQEKRKSASKKPGKKNDKNPKKGLVSALRDVLARYS